MLRTGALVVLGLALVLGLASCRHADPEVGPSQPQRLTDVVEIQTSDVPLSPGRPGPLQLGRFRFIKGLHLTSPSTERFHGLSDMVIASDGAIDIVSDEGVLFSGKLRLDGQGELLGLTDMRLHSLTGLDGKLLEGKARSDAEGITRLTSGERLISFERQDRIWIYPAAGSAPPRPFPFPPLTPPDNEGVEALSVAPGSGADAVWVGLEAGQVFICQSDRPCSPKLDAPRPPAGFRLTAISESAQGQVGFLFHKFRPIGGTDVVLVLCQRQPSGSLEIVDQLSMAPDLDLDNFEGLSLRSAPDGKLSILMISDDNFSNSQRTLLYQFLWTPAAAAPSRTIVQ
jgi:hypothetical protein